jgi:H+-transporting ATPase
MLSPLYRPASRQRIAAKGLASDEARARLAKDGPNAMPDTSAHPLRNATAKFWAPVPWLLEASIVLELVLHKYYEAAIIAGLLVFNAALAYFQEGRAQATLAALKSRLALNASVQRDGTWKTVPVAELVCGDLVKLSLGGVVAADVHLTGGSIELDQSMLTGESLPIDAGPDADTFFDGRCPYHFNSCGLGNRHGPVACRRNCLGVCRSNRIRCDPRRGEDSRFCPS